MRIKNLFKKVFLVVIIVTLSMSVDAQYNRRGSNNTNSNGSSIVDEAANGVINGVKGLFSKKKDKSENKDKKDNKKDKKDKKGSKSKNEPLANDDIELIVSGDGSTKEQATLAALRSAIEQAYGTFVSSNTQILNDELVKDEIVSISKGNIKRYDYLSESVINGKNYVTLKAVVSIGQLVSYAKSKGSSAELAGATFAMDVKMKKLNRENATKAYDNFIEQLEMMVGQMFDYSIEIGELHAGRNGQGGVSSTLFLPVKLKIKSNKNYENVRDFIWNTLPNLWLNSSELKEYESKGIQYIGITRFYCDRNPYPEKCDKEVYDRDYCFKTSPLYKSNKSLKKVLMKAFTFVIKDDIGSYVFIPRKESGGTYTVNIEGNRGSFDAHEIFDFEQFIDWKMRQNGKQPASMGWFDEGGGFFPFPIDGSYNVQIEGYLSYSQDEIDKISNIEVKAADVDLNRYF